MFKKSIDLSKFEAMYNQFGDGHGLGHISKVRNLAVKLAKKYLPNKIKLAYVAATLHDIGLVNGRENHEITGSKMVLESKELHKFLSDEEIQEIAYAIREHRASTGKPKTILAKIISDSDKASDSSTEAMKRAIEYGKVNMPELNETEQIWRAAKHLTEKFGVGGSGRRTYFPESEQALEKTYKPIFKAVKKSDHKSLVEIIQVRKTSN
jgi:HD superfamily phosphodiesterase